MKQQKNRWLPRSTGSVVGAMALIGLLWLDAWVVLGMFNDSFLLFRFTSYVGVYVPYLAIVALLLAFILIRIKLLRLFVVLVSLPALVLPSALPKLSAGGERWSYDGSYDDHRVLSVLSYSRTGHNKEYSRISELVDCAKHDIILLQEFADIDEFSELYSDQLSKCNIVFPQSKHSYKSVGIISAYEIYDARVTDAGVRGTVDVDGQLVEVLTSRLSRSTTKDGLNKQRRQVQLMIEQLEGVTPVVVAGDFNSTLHNESIYRMRQHFAYAGPGNTGLAGATFPAEKRWYSFLGALVGIDHIFYRGMVLLSSEVLGDSFGSDHYPVRAEFALPALESTNE